MRGDFLYLVAMMDWFSRFVLSWELSNTLETSFCSAALEAAFYFGQLEIWDADQGAQFTSADFHPGEYPGNDSGRQRTGQ